MGPTSKGKGREARRGRRVWQGRGRRDRPLNQTFGIRHVKIK